MTWLWNWSDFARLTHEQCDRVDWISAIVSAPNGKMIIHKRWVHHMQVLLSVRRRICDVYEIREFLPHNPKILTGMDGIPTDPLLCRQKYTNAFLELQQFLPDLKLRICRSWETNPALAGVIHDLQQLGASFLYKEDPLECLLSSAPAPTKTLPVNSGFYPNGTPTTESIQRVDTQSCTIEIDPREHSGGSASTLHFRVSHYGDDTAQSSLGSSDIRVPIPSDEMTIPTGTEASEPPNYQVDARPSVHCVHQTIISEDAPIAPPTDLQTTDANPCASQPVISHQADEIDAPILRTITYEDDESVSEPNPCERAGTSDAHPDPTQARNTTTDNAEDHITQFIQSVEMSLDDELNEFLQITSDICTTLDGRIQAAQCMTDPEYELNDCNMPTAESQLQLSQPAFTLHHPTYKPSDPLDPEMPGTEPPHHRLHNFPAGLAEDIMSFSRHSLRPAFANDTHHHVSTGSVPICPVSEPTGSSLQDHDGDNDNVPPPTTSTTKPTADDDFTTTSPKLEGRNESRIPRSPCQKSSTQHPPPHEAQGSPTKQTTGWNFWGGTQRIQASGLPGPRARNHRRNICRPNKHKAARMSSMSSQAQKKTHAISSGRADNRVQLLTKKANKSSGMGIYHAGYTALPEEKDKLSKKKVDKPSGMETHYLGYTNISDERVRKLIRDELRLTALGQCTLSNWFQSASNPPREYTMRAQQCYLKTKRDPNRFAYNSLTDGS
ncbi:hypothetical protein THAOC_09583 [Thalassiosira oceanica]|uniref:Uncharacterized protein n=1 Tax=Thalassiosira oceanica TaxID=159749 RepID=K0SW77_THAOC|nr:hypothetical protein THAOC_09583 [Thalassiosira oceanica]|eukprot:EJK69189.1 hypothetical protein THAOC_09583 [Thalassiosira oceanica]